MSNKGFQGKDETFATGGAALGRTKEFIKTPDRFRDSQFKAAPKTDETWAKSGKGPEGADKSLTPVTPRS